MSTPSSLVRQIVNALLTLAGILIGYGFLHHLCDPRPLTATDWRIPAALVMLAIVWAQIVSQVTAGTVLSGFFIGLLSTYFLAGTPHITHTISTWLYGAELGVLGVLIASASAVRVRFWLLKKPTLRLGVFLFIALGIDLANGYKNQLMELNQFLLFSLTSMAAGLLVGLVFRITHVVTSKEKEESFSPQNDTRQAEIKKITQTPIAPLPQKKQKTIPASKQRQNKKSQKPPTQNPITPESPKETPALNTQENPAPQSAPKQDDLTSAYDLLDRIKKNKNKNGD